MSDNMSDDFSFFATGKRVSKEPATQARSPLDSGNKWTVQEGARVEAKIETRQERQQSSQAPQASQGSSQVEVRSPRYETISSRREESADQIGNVGSELQKLRKYPEKKYDQLLSKVVLFNEEEYFLIRDLASEISIAKKRSTIANKGSLPRVTENTVIRAALKAICSKIGKSNLDLSTLQTEEALERYFNSLLK